MRYVLKEDKNYVLLTGDQTIYGNKTFANNVTIVGNLYVSGSTVSKSDLNITSNYITINSGETGSGVTLTNSGIRVDRGWYTDYVFIFNETTDTFRIGEDNNTQAVATRQDSPVNNSLVFWNNSVTRFDTSADLTISVSSPSNNDILMYNGTNWINTDFDLSAYYTKTEVNNNFTSASTFNLHANDSTIHFTKSSIRLDDLGDVNTGGTIQGYYLSYSAGTWVGVPDATDLSNYYTKQQVYNTGQTNANFLSANTSFYTQSQANANFLSANTSFYTQSQANANFLSASTTITQLSGYTITETNNNFTSASTFNTHVNNYNTFTGNTQTLYNDTKNYTGFVNGSNIDIRYDYTGRTITLTGDLSYYYLGVKYELTSPWTSTGHSDIVGNWYLYSTDGINFNWSQSPWSFMNIMVSGIYYQSNSSLTFGIRETHELMDFHAHEDLHNNVGTWLRTGGQAIEYSYTANTATDAAVSPNFNTAYVDDEDLESTILAVYKESGYTIMYISGLTSVYNLASTRPFLALAADQYIYVNTVSTGALTAGINNRFYNVYQILVPTTSDVVSQQYRMIFLQPQQTFTTLAAAQAEDTRGLSLGSLTSASAEYVIYARITYSTNNTYTNYGKVVIPTNGISYVVGSKMSSLSVAGVSSTNHANLSNLTWITSGHISTADSLASFDSSGNAEILLKTYFLSTTDAANNFLSANTSFYTQAQSDANFLSASTTITQLSGYTITEVNDNFLSANTSYYTQTQVNENFLSASTFLITGATNLGNGILIYTGVTNNSLQLKSLQEGTGIILTATETEITINAMDEALAIAYAIAL